MIHAFLASIFLWCFIFAAAISPEWFLAAAFVATTGTMLDLSNVFMDWWVGPHDVSEDERNEWN